MYCPCTQRSSDHLLCPVQIYIEKGHCPTIIPMSYLRLKEQVLAGRGSWRQGPIPPGLPCTARPGEMWLGCRGQCRLETSWRCSEHAMPPSLHPISVLERPRLMCRVRMTFSSWGGPTHTGNRCSVGSVADCAVSAQLQQSIHTTFCILQPRTAMKALHAPD